MNEIKAIQNPQYEIFDANSLTKSIVNDARLYLPSVGECPREDHIFCRNHTIPRHKNRIQV